MIRFKRKNTQISLCVFCVGTFLSSRAAARQVFSAQVSLTSVFGMGTGGPSSQSAPTEKSTDFSIKQHMPFYLQLFKKCGDPYEIRTRVAGVRGRSLRPLDQRATKRTLSAI